MDIFKEITATIGIDDNPYMLKKMIVDKTLLGNRNKIAHGEKLETLDGIYNTTEYIKLHIMIVELIDNFAQNVREAARNEDYKL